MVLIDTTLLRNAVKHLAEGDWVRRDIQAVLDSPEAAPDPNDREIERLRGILIKERATRKRDVDDVTNSILHCVKARSVMEQCEVLMDQAATALTVNGPTELVERLENAVNYLKTYDYDENFCEREG